MLLIYRLLTLMTVLFSAILREEKADRDIGGCVI